MTISNVLGKGLNVRVVLGPVSRIKKLARGNILGKGSNVRVVLSPVSRIMTLARHIFDLWGRFAGDGSVRGYSMEQPVPYPQAHLT